MSRLEQALLGRWSGWGMVKASAAVIAAGVAPLLAYIAVGPADGNPIGLGLLAVAAVLFGGAGVVVGAVMVVECFRA